MRNGILTIWKAKDGFRWHLQVSGRIVAESGEGYVNKGHAVKMAKRYLRPSRIGKVREA